MLFWCVSILFLNNIFALVLHINDASCFKSLWSVIVIGWKKGNHPSFNFHVDQGSLTCSGNRVKLRSSVGEH